MELMTFRICESCGFSHPPIPPGEKCPNAKEVSPSGKIIEYDNFFVSLSFSNKSLLLLCSNWLLLIVVCAVTAVGLDWVARFLIYLALAISVVLSQLCVGIINYIETNRLFLLALRSTIIWYIFEYACACFLIIIAFYNVVCWWLLLWVLCCRVSLWSVKNYW